jgi:hypothetical protein
MTETAISPLRRRMIEDMTVRNFRLEHTQRLHLSCQGVRGVPSAARLTRLRPRICGVSSYT